jgi:tetratricopeptide (TPR) repeat protein
MKRLFLSGLSLIAVAGCATSPRIGPPAPIETRGAWGPGAAAKAGEAAPPQEQAQTPEVEVYPYHAPGTAPPGAGQAPGAAQAPPGQGSLAGGTAPGELPVERPEYPAGAQQPQQTPSVRQPQTLAYAPPPKRPVLPPAADALLREAERQRQMRDYVGAAATLERALRIEPRQAYLWNRLAQVRLEQGYQAQAANLAARSNSLARDEPGLKQDNWRIIAAARRAAGDAAGAAAAEQKARGG